MKKLLTMDVLVPNNDEDRSKIRYGNVNCGDSESLNCWTQLAYFDIIFEFYQNSLFFEIISSFICWLLCCACRYVNNNNNNKNWLFKMIDWIELNWMMMSFWELKNTCIHQHIIHLFIYLFIYLSMIEWMKWNEMNEWCVKWKKKKKKKKKGGRDGCFFFQYRSIWYLTSIYLYLYI